MRKILITIYLLATSFIAHAEIYKDFTPNLSLEQIKSNYPNAVLQDIKAAWVKEDEALLKLSGGGISGAIMLKLSTMDKLANSLMGYLQSELEMAKNDEEKAKAQENIIFWKNYIALPKEKKLTLDWVRWIPESPFPFERIQGKYGKPDSCEYSDEDYAPFCNWKKKGVLVNLTDDRKRVTSVEYTFTKEERELYKNN